EADAIAVKMQSISVPRPLTHDLLCNVASIARLKIKSAIINKLEKDTFYAKLVLASPDRCYEIDCRPSDALAVALRVGAPIFANEKVLAKAAIHLEEETGKLIEPRKDENGKLGIFSESAQEALSLAEKEAKRLNHNFVSTGHLLLALLKSVPTAASEVLNNLGINLAKIPKEIEVSINQPNIESGEIGLSPALKKTIELTIEEAKRLGSEKVLPEHFLIGLTRENEGIAANLMKNLGINTEKIYVELIRLYTSSGISNIWE
ncbi:unnamed protein product, partial [marine sediment metagenome]